MACLASDTRVQHEILAYPNRTYSTEHTRASIYYEINKVAPIDGNIPPRCNNVNIEEKKHKLQVLILTCRRNTRNVSQVIVATETDSEINCTVPINVSSIDNSGMILIDIQ